MTTYSGRFPVRLRAIGVKREYGAVPKQRCQIRNCPRTCKWRATRIATGPDRLGRRGTHGRTKSGDLPSWGWSPIQLAAPRGGFHIMPSGKTVRRP